MLKGPLATIRGGLSATVASTRRARLTVGSPAVWHLTRRVVPYGAYTAGWLTNGQGGRRYARIPMLEGSALMGMRCE